MGSQGSEPFDQYRVSRTLFLNLEALFDTAFEERVVAGVTSWFRSRLSRKSGAKSLKLISF